MMNHAVSPSNPDSASTLPPSNRRRIEIPDLEVERSRRSESAPIPFSQLLHTTLSLSNSPATRFSHQVPPPPRFSYVVVTPEGKTTKPSSSAPSEAKQPGKVASIEDNESSKKKDEQSPEALINDQYLVASERQVTKYFPSFDLT